MLGSSLGFTVQTFPDCVNPIADQLESKMKIKNTSEDRGRTVPNISVSLPPMESFSVNPNSELERDDFIQDESEHSDVIVESEVPSSSSRTEEENSKIKEVGIRNQHLGINAVGTFFSTE